MHQTSLPPAAIEMLAPEEFANRSAIGPGYDMRALGLRLGGVERPAELAVTRDIHELAGFLLPMGFFRF